MTTRTAGKGTDHGNGVLVAEDVRLTDWFREMAAARRPCRSERSWRSLADELGFTATCDSLGHLTLGVTIQTHPWRPTWTATVVLTHTLGDLSPLADDLATWLVS